MTAMMRLAVVGDDAQKGNDRFGAESGRAAFGGKGPVSYGWQSDAQDQMAAIERE